MGEAESVTDVNEFESKAYQPDKLTPAEEIQKIRLTPKLPQFRELQMISGVVIRTFKDSATLIKSNSFRYLFDKATRQVYIVGDNREFRSFINENFGINSEFKYVLNEIEKEIEFRGQESQVFRFAFYDKLQNRLFIDRRNGQVLMLDGESIQVLDNGASGVFFINSEKSEPIIYEEAESKNCYFCDKGFRFGAPDWVVDSPLLNTLTGGLQFVGALTEDEQKSLLLLMIYVIFFESLHPTKPVVVVTGSKGSGKTDLCRNIGRILFGKTFNVTRFRNDERDFITTCAHNYLIVLDNLEEKAKWLMDMVAIIATGGETKLRELHTTCTQIVIKLTSFLFLNAIDPKLRRDDIADRLLIIQLDRLNKFKSETEIENEIREASPKIWGEILLNLNGIIRCLKKDETIPPGKFRLQDFENFAKRICANPEEIEATLEKLEGLRSEYSLQNDNLCLFLDKWLDKESIAGGSNIGLHVTAKELLFSFQEIAKIEKLDFFYSTPNALGKKIHQIEPELKRLFELEVMPEKGGRPTGYKFMKKR